MRIILLTGFAFLLAMPAAIASGTLNPYPQQPVVYDPPPEQQQQQLQNDTDGPNLVQGLANNPSLASFLDAMKRSDVANMLAAEGPFTVFAASDAAFSRLPKKTREQLMEDKAALAKVMTYHVVPGKIGMGDLSEMLRQRSGRAVLTTVQGQNLIATRNGNGVWTLADENNNRATIAAVDMTFANGVVHMIDTVMMPK